MQKMLPVTLTFIFLVICFFPKCFLYADTIFLDTGEVITGKITSRSSGNVSIRTKNGNVRTLRKSKVFRMYFRDVTLEEKRRVKRLLGLQKNYTSPKAYSYTKSPMSQEELNLRKKELNLRERELTFKEEYFKRQMDFLEEELRYLRQEREKLKTRRVLNLKFRRSIERKIANLEQRNKRLEKLFRDEQHRLDAFRKSGSPWELVWRSTLLPGWGHRYVGEDIIGDSYAASILVFLVSGFGLKYDARLGKQYLDEKLTNDVVVRPILFNSFTSSTSVNNILSILAFQSYYSYNNDSSNVRAEKRLGNNLIGVGVGLYFLQIAHAYITGYNIKKQKVKSESRGWNIYFHSLNTDRDLSVQNSSFVLGLSYTFFY